MNSIRRYIPSFMDGLEEERCTVTFDTLDELLNIDFVKVFKNKTFYRYTMTENCLMAECNNGQRWYVVGFIEFPDLIDLPKVRY